MSNAQYSPPPASDPEAFSSSSASAAPPHPHPHPRPPSSSGSPASAAPSTGADSSSAHNTTVTSQASASDNDRSPGLSSFSSGSDVKSREQTVPAACLGCRSKHLKCDGQTPCSRCISSEYECHYVASRRGYKGPRRGNPNKRPATSSPDGHFVDAAACPMLLGAGSSGHTRTVPGVGMLGAAVNPHYSSQRAINGDQLYNSYCAVAGGGPPRGALTQYSSTADALIPVPTLQERCLDSFYHYFHRGHPFVLPKEFLLRKAKEGTIEPLFAAMQWAGSLYIDAAPYRPALLEDALRLACDPHQPKNGFLLQAIMVLIVALDGSCENDKARELLDVAERMALEIDINTRPFATLKGEDLPVLEESWRRTWWDLFVIDGMIAGVHRVTHFLLFDVPTDVALPCEEHQYLSGNIPPPAYLEDLEDCDFSGDDREFSSFAYRILCGRNLGKFMRTPTICGPEDPNLARIETLLTNWRLHLPASKKYALDRNGQLDEMMFQANMMTHATSILLHQPHSQLDASPAETVTSCAPYQRVNSGELFNTHTRHTISSAVEISKMITHAVPLLSHTHFFTCVITLSSIVHLSRWAALYFDQHDDDELRQQIRLNIGALNTLSEVWSAAERARGQVKGVAQEIYKVKKQQQMSPQYWTGYSQADQLHSIAADESIIREIEALQEALVIPALE